VQLAELPAALAEADIVLSAVDSARPVVTPEMRASVADRNVLFVDLGVPRNIDPFYDDWGHGVTVADLDDLKLWHRVKTGVLNEVRTKADAVIRAEYRQS
jgi:glutamyl-tRNA reductase